jgi:hypothetical protein
MRGTADNFSVPSPLFLPEGGSRIQLTKRNVIILKFRYGRSPKEQFYTRF